MNSKRAIFPANRINSKYAIFPVNRMNSNYAIYLCPDDLVLCSLPPLMQLQNFSSLLVSRFIPLFLADKIVRESL